MPFFSSTRNTFGVSGKNSPRGSSSNPATSAKELLQYGIKQDGVYWIRASQSAPAQQIYCILDPAWDGGGWMVVMNNAAQDIVYLSSHIPRLTANPTRVGNSTGGNSYSKEFNFSINCQDMQFTDFVFAAYQSTQTWKEIYVYYAGKFNSPSYIPTNADIYTRIFDISDVTLPFTSAPKFRPANADQARVTDLFSMYDGNVGYGTYTPNHSYSPVFVMGEPTQKGNPTTAFPATTNDVNCIGVGAVWSITDRFLISATTTILPPEGTGPQSIRGWEDWQDGNSLADLWGATNSIQNYGRGLPSYVMIR